MLRFSFHLKPPPPPPRGLSRRSFVRSLSFSERRGEWLRLRLDGPGERERDLRSAIVLLLWLMSWDCEGTLDDEARRLWAARLRISIVPRTSAVLASCWQWSRKTKHKNLTSYRVHTNPKVFQKAAFTVPTNESWSIGQKGQVKWLAIGTTRVMVGIQEEAYIEETKVRKSRKPIDDDIHPKIPRPCIYSEAGQSDGCVSIQHAQIRNTLHSTRAKCLLSW